MALVLADRVRETTTTTGTGAVTLGGAYTGFQTFSSGIGNANTTYYTIANTVTGEWEVGIGTYTSASNTLSRDTILSSSNSGSAVNFTAGSKDVFVTQPAERNMYVSGTNVVAANGATVPNSLLANSSVTLGSTAVSLGGTATTVAGLTLTGAAVNGTLGATTPSTASVTSLTDSGNLTFTGTGNRITGDFSNATIASRVLLQTSTVNGNTSVGAVPNGTSTQSNLRAYSAADPTNASFADIVMDGATAIFRSDKAGTGTYLPMTFYTGGSERLRIDTSGIGSFTNNVNIGTSYTASLQFNGAAGYTQIVSYGSATDISLNLYAKGSAAVTFNTNNGVLQLAAAGLGYGTGSGGTVTQTTSRTTGVTLNKPTGAITLFSAAGTPTWQTFVVTNSTVSATDTVQVSFKSGTNAYIGAVNSVSAGSFAITFSAVAGVAIDSPVLNFAIIKGATS